MAIICKYKFNSTLCADYLPEFNSEFTGYTKTDVDNGDNTITRTIEHNTLLPTLIRFGTTGNTTDRERSLLELIECDTSNVIDMSHMFRECLSLTLLDLSNCDTTNVTDMWAMFYSCTSLTSIDVSSFNTSNVTNMKEMFNNCSSLTSLDLSNFDTSKVIDMGWMFRYCSSLVSLNVSSFNTSNVTNMNAMFSNCTSLISLDLSSFNTSNVTDMSYMFDNCNKLISLDVSNFNTSKVTDMSWMFHSCRLLTSLNVSSFNTSNVTNMGRMFQECSSLTSIDLSNFNTSKVISMARMFQGCTSLSFLDISNFDINNVSNTNSMFDIMDNIKVLSIRNNNENISKLTDVLPTTTDGYVFIQDIDDTVDVSGITSKGWNIINNKEILSIYNMTKDTATKDVPTFNEEYTYEYVDIVSDTSIKRTIYGSNLPTSMKFTGCNTITTFDYINTEVVNSMTNMRDMFSNCNKLASLDLSNFDTGNVTDMAWMFKDCIKLISLNISNFDTSNVQYMDNMFSGCTSLTTLDLSNFDTNKVIEMGAMFSGCTSLTTLDLSNFDTNKVINMGSMFQNCNKLTLLNISNFNTSKVTNMGDMIRDCTKLTSIDLSNFNTSKVISMARMFSNCTSLTSLDLSNFDTSNVTDMGDMFGYCSLLTSLNISNFNTSKVTNIGSMFQNCTSLTSLDLSNFDTSNTNNMGDMFKNCNKLTSLNVSNFDTSKVTNMVGMFYSCSSLTALDLSSFNTSKVTSMNDMFRDCFSLKSLNVSNFNTSEVANMGHMFHNCGKLTSLDLSSFDTSNINGWMDYMFQYCISLTSLDLSNFTINDTVNTTNMFSNTLLLSDIGMVYCTKSTIDKVSSLVGHSCNIYVNSVIPDDCTPVNGITFIFDGDTREMNHEPLRAVGGAKDRYVLLDGKWFIERNVGKYIYTGKEPWSPVDDDRTTDTARTFLALNTPLNAKADGNLTTFKSDKLPNKMHTSSDLGIWIDIHTFITLPRNEVNTIAELKLWLQSNPITGLYQLRTPQYEQIDYNPLKVYSEVTHITTNSTIPTNITVKNHGYNCLLKPSTTYTISSNLGLNTVTTPSELTEDCLRFMDTDTSDVTTMRDVLVLEGDWTSKADLIPSNFSGIESAFEQEYDAEKGKYKVNVKITNEDKTKENNITFYINEPLRGVGDVKDRVFIKDDKVVVERNCGSYIINDGSNFYISNHNNVSRNGVNRFVFDGVLLPNSKDLSNDGCSNICNILPVVSSKGTQEIGFECISIRGGIPIWGVMICVKQPSVASFNQWLQQNPITIVYELAEPTYEEVEYSSNRLILDTFNNESFNNSTLFLNTNISPKISLKPLFEELVYVKSNTKYYIQFNAVGSGEVVINLGGTELTTEIVEGYNCIPITTPSESTNLMTISGQGITISKVVVSEAICVGYYKGLQSCFEEHMENGKYRILLRGIALDGSKVNGIKLYINEPLRGIESAKDRLCIKDGKLMVERNIAERIVDDTTPINMSITNDKFTRFTVYHEGVRYPDHNLIKCSGFPTRGDKLDAETVLLNTDNIVFAIANARLKSIDTEGFKDWIKEHPQKVQFKVSTTYEEVTNEYGLPIVFEGYENGIVYIDSVVTPTTHIKYTSNNQLATTLAEAEEQNIATQEDINMNVITYMMDIDMMLTDMEMSNDISVMAVRRDSSNENMLDRMSEEDKKVYRDNTVVMLEKMITAKALEKEDIERRIDMYYNKNRISKEQYKYLKSLL